jgi:hypothetical protein
MLSLLQFKKCKVIIHRHRERESLMRKIFVSDHRVQSPAQLSRVLWAVFSLDAFLMGLITYSPE